MVEPYLDDGDVAIYVGDSRAVLAELPDQSVHAIATSPPFYGLRDYGTGEWEGGDPDCPHEKPATTMNVGFNERWGQGGGEKRQERKSGGQHSGTCPDCGAARIDHQIGLEATPDAWADSIVEVMAEAWRVLRDDGSLWVECGDSYAAKVPYYASDSMNERSGRSREKATRPQPTGDLKEKDLVGAPYLLAFALRRDGWYWRGAYAWEKPDCMPESISDRCTTSHSTILHFAKSGDPTFWTHRDGRGSRRRMPPDYRWVNRRTGEETSMQPGTNENQFRRINLWRGRDYYFDLDAIREPFSDYSTGGDGGSYGAKADGVRIWEGGSRGSTRHVRHREEQDDGHVQPTLDGDVPEPERRGPDGRKKLEHKVGENGHDNYDNRDGAQRWPSLEGRSPRSVWRITTEANSFGLCPVCRTFFPERAPARHCGADVVAHFAVWPHELVGKIIRAATSEGGCCADCGAPRFRCVDQGTSSWPERREAGAVRGNLVNGAGTQRGVHGVGVSHDLMPRSRTQTGWQPTCACDGDTVPATVLDVFGGSGTTARQARTLGRHAVLIELSPDYAEIASHRLAQQALPLLAAE